jgi:hypothetical protein
MAPTLLKTMTRYWNQLEGVSLAGRHWLKQCLTSTPEDAWYLTRFDTERNAAVRVMPANAEGAEAQLTMWRRAMDFEHPHLVRMLDAGRTEAEGADLIYAVCEYPDEFVSGVLADRPLSPGEAHEVLNASLAALGFLHEKGLAHGGVDPSHIMAFGDTIKLPSDTIREAGGAVAAADDMRALGATLYEVLTQQAPGTAGEGEYGHLPEPFGTIVRHTLRANPAERWTVEDVERHLHPPVVERRVVAPQAVEEPIVEAPAIEERVVAPLVEEEAPRPAVRVKVAQAGETLPFAAGPSRRDEPPVDRGFPMKWVPVAGLVAAVGLSVVILRKPAEVATAPPPAVVQKSSPAQSAERAAPTPGSAPVVVPRAAAPVAAPAVSRPGAIWRVVVYTFNSRGAAEKKARSINEKRAAWRADVFAPRGDRAPFYVSLGGRMTLPEAERLQKEARSKGLPRDTFVRNFKD